VGEIDDVEQPEDDGQAEAQHGIERAVDQPEQELAEESLRRDSEKLEHVCG
jgi:hypothetical protein